MYFIVRRGARAGRSEHVDRAAQNSGPNRQNRRRPRAGWPAECQSGHPECARPRALHERRVLGPPAAGRPRHTAKPARPTSLHFTRACVRSREWAPRRYSCRVACVAVAPTPSLRRDAPAHEHHWQGGGVERGAAHWVRARERARGAAPCRPCCASSLGPRGSACARTELEERWTSRKSTVGCARCSRS